MIDLETQFNYQISFGESLTRFLYSDVKLTPFSSEKEAMNDEVSMIEGYFDVEYPVRREFLKKRLKKIIDYREVEMKYVYSAFEGESVDLSSFISTPHHLECWAKTFIQCEVDTTYQFNLKTCGGIRIWVNGELQVSFDPFSRNHGVSKKIDLKFTKGKNEVFIYFDDLAERDVMYSFQLTSCSENNIEGYIPLSYEHQKLDKVEAYLSSLYTETDCYTSGEINLISPNPETLIPWVKELRVRINPKTLEVNKDMQDGNITEFKVEDYFVPITTGQICIGKVESFNTAGLTKCEIGIKMADNSYVTRKLVFAVYNEEKFKHIITAESLSERKREALDYFSTLDLEDVNVGLVKLLLGKELRYDSKLNQYLDFATAFSLIEAKGDCADFVLAPILAILTKFPDKFPENLKVEIERLSLKFRYWIDEPGTDVMWYFSENHALLFHVAQYFAGYLFPNGYFSESNKNGSAVYEIGKTRLKEWFDNFFKYGFSEWNSITYLPIDLIGFFSLYIAAPDEEIKTLSKKALDFTFEIIAINFYKGMLASTYGRVYEHNLKAGPLGEITSLTKVAWGSGYFNNALRATALFAISNYEPSTKLNAYKELKANEYLKAEYIQGVNKVQTYQFKTADYSISSAINYIPYSLGHQQHMINIALESGKTQFWINHPGERTFSGENRPSYWAGNGMMPYIYQYKNIAMMQYKISDDLVDFIHLYLPYWEIDEVEQRGNWLFLNKGGCYCAVFFSNGYMIVQENAVAKREVKSFGREHALIVKCSSKAECGSFLNFISNMTNSPVSNKTHFKYHDFQEGCLEMSSGGLKVKGEPVKYHSEYSRNMTIKRR